MDSDDRGPYVISVVWTLTFLAALFLGARVYIKLISKRGLWWDDWVLILSWLFLVINVSLVTHTTTLGYGKHMGAFPIENIVTIAFYAQIATTFCLAAISLSKTSFAITLLRLGGPSWVRFSLWAIIFTLNGILFFNAIMPYVSCRPVAAAWGGAEGTCWDGKATQKFAIASSSYSAAVDFILAFIPWAILKNLQIKMREKIGIAVCMGLGIVAGSTSIVRCIHITLANKADFTHEGVPLFIWFVAETSTTIMATSIPVLRTLLNAFFKSTLDKSGYHQSTMDGTFRSGQNRTTTVTASRKDPSRATVITDDDASTKNIVKVEETIVVDYEMRKTMSKDQSSSIEMLPIRGRDNWPMPTSNN